MKKYLFLLFYAAFLFAACSGDDIIPDTPDVPDEPEVTAEITIPSTEDIAPVFTSEGGTKSITFSSVLNWTAKVVESQASWCKVSPASGGSGNHTLTITIAANDTPDSRTATVQLASGNVTKNISITQKQKDALTVTTNKFEIPAEGGNIDIEAKANVELSYTIDDSGKSWISYVETKAMKTSHLVFKVSANEKTEVRVAKITVSGGGISEEITVAQAAKVPTEFEISQKEIEVGSDKSTFELMITSNIGYEVKPEADWITQTAVNGSNGVYTHTFEVAENTSTDKREGIIVVCNDEQTCIPVVVKQAGADVFTISTNNVEVGYEQCTFEVSVSSSMGYEIKPQVDWIREITSKAVSNNVHVFEVSENSLTQAREGIIVVCNDAQTCIPITVKQKGAPDVDTDWAAKEFFHKSLGMRFTADWCGYCPMMATAFDDARNQLPGKLEVLSLHASGGLYSTVSDKLAQQYNIGGFPTGYVDGRVEIPNYSQISHTTSLIVQEVNNTEANYETVTGAGWSSAISGNKVSLDLQVYLKKSGSYKVTALLVEDNIVGYQNGASDNYVHKDIVRAAFTNALGDNVTITEDSKVKVLSYSLNKQDDWDKANLRIVVYIEAKDNKGAYYVNNAASAAVGKKQPLMVISNNSGGVEGIVPGENITF